MNKKELLINLIWNAIFMCFFIVITNSTYKSLQLFRQFSITYFVLLFLSVLFVFRVGCNIAVLLMLPYFGDDEDE